MQLTFVAIKEGKCVLCVDVSWEDQEEELATSKRLATPCLAEPHSQGPGQSWGRGGRIVTGEARPRLIQRDSGYFLQHFAIGPSSTWLGHRAL